MLLWEHWCDLRVLGLVSIVPITTWLGENTLWDNLLIKSSKQLLTFGKFTV